MKLLHLLAGLGAVAGTAAAAQAQVFSVHDVDRDGRLSRAEYVALQAHCSARRGERCRAALLPFEALDADGSGDIDECELLDALGRRHRGGRGG